MPPVLFLVYPVHARQDLLDLARKPLLLLAHPPVAHRLVPRRVRPDLRPVDRHHPEFPQPRPPREHQRLSEHLRKVLPVTHPEAVDRPEVRIGPLARQIAKAQIPVDLPRNLSTAVDALRGSVQPQLQQKTRVVRMLPHSRVARIERRQIQALDHVVDEKRRVRWIQSLTQVRRKHLPLVLLVRFEAHLFPHEP